MPSSAGCSRGCKNSGLARDTIIVFASDDGPRGEVVREFGGDMPDMESQPIPRRTG